jgi:type I restriction enzyme, S subunit
VPAHWEVGRVKHYCDFLDGKRVPLNAEERGARQGEYPYYGASGIIDHVDDFIFDEGLVLVAEDGANLLNRATPLAFVSRGRYWVNNHAHILRPTDRQLGFWAARIEAEDVAPIVSGSAQPKLTIDALANLPVAVPVSTGERASISTFVEQTQVLFDKPMEKSRHVIALLREHRSALISAVVTGKIDVRDEAAVAASEELVTA